jgi:glucan 1,3-beta-glucosidase
MIGWAVENVPLESLTIGDWLRSLAWAAVALVLPVVGAAAVASGARAPRFAQMLGRAGERPRDRLAFLLGILVIALAVLSIQAALGLVFDPRYRDFPFAPLTGAVIPLFLLVTYSGTWKLRLKAPAAEMAMAATLAAAAVYVACNESFANWQALWFAAGLLAFALILLRASDAPG